MATPPPAPDRPELTCPGCGRRIRGAAAARRLQPGADRRCAPCQHRAERAAGHVWGAARRQP